MRERWGDLRSACHAKRWPEVDKILDAWDEDTREDARAYAKEHGYKPSFARVAAMLSGLATSSLAAAEEAIAIQRAHDQALRRIMSKG